MGIPIIPSLVLSVSMRIIEGILTFLLFAITDTKAFGLGNGKKFDYDLVVIGAGGKIIISA